jgi:hypothetical protein
MLSPNYDLPCALIRMARITSYIFASCTLRYIEFWRASITFSESSSFVIDLVVLRTLAHTAPEPWGQGVHGSQALRDDFDLVPSPSAIDYFSLDANTIPCILEGHSSRYDQIRMDRPSGYLEVFNEGCTTLEVIKLWSCHNLFHLRSHFNGRSQLMQFCLEQSLNMKKTTDPHLNSLCGVLETSNRASFKYL